MCLQNFLRLSISFSFEQSEDFPSSISFTLSSTCLIIAAHEGPAYLNVMRHLYNVKMNIEAVSHCLFRRRFLRNITKMHLEACLQYHYCSTYHSRP